MRFFTQEEANGALKLLRPQVERLVDRRHGLGVQVKDLDEGLVDFPAVHPESGDAVLLCWRPDEPAVAWWHGLEDGLAGRKPLPF
jgi:hypothetical protein